jgi:hypothetical protein
MEGFPILGRLAASRRRKTQTLVGRASLGLCFHFNVSPLPTAWHTMLIILLDHVTACDSGGDLLLQTEKHPLERLANTPMLLNQQVAQSHQPPSTGLLVTGR